VKRPGSRMLLKGTVVTTVLLISAACGSGSSSSSDGAGASGPSASTTSAPAHTLSFCPDVAELDATRQSLSHVTNSLPTSTAMKAAASGIESSLAGLGRRTEWQTQIDNLKTAVANMQSAADRLAASPGARGVSSQVRTSVAGVNDSIRRLVTAVGDRCPSPSPSPSS
jgi:hypothetical protein